MKKLWLIMGWFGMVVPIMFYCLFTLNSYSKIKDGSILLSQQAKTMLPKNGYQLYASLPQVLGTFTVALQTQDARPEIIRQFLQKHDSPFSNQAQLIVNTSDAKNIDYRLITSIAMCESNLGKKVPKDSYNAFGYAVYTGEESGAKFDNWEQSIKVMADYLDDKFYSQGLTTPEQIGPIYAPPSVENGNSWAKCVRGYMDELR